MSGVERKKRLFEQIVRLRRAEREAPGSRDIVAVRAQLEEELGRTLARSTAASLLGVSHTALNRWTRSGDVPLVPTPRGRDEIPVAAVVDLYEAVDASGRSRHHALERALAPGRDRARRLRPNELIGGQDSGGDLHRRAELRSLAYHRALARRLRRSMIGDARHTLWEWRDRGTIDPRYADEWESVLDRPLAEIARIISADDQRGRDLRQNSPFAGLLSEAERRRIVSEVR